MVHHIRNFPDYAGCFKVVFEREVNIAPLGELLSAFLASWVLCQEAWMKQDYVRLRDGQPRPCVSALDCNMQMFQPPVTLLESTCCIWRFVTFIMCFVLQIGPFFDERDEFQCSRFS